MSKARIAACPLAVTAIAGLPPEIDALAPQTFPSHGFPCAALARANKVAGLDWPFRGILTAPDCTPYELAAALADLAQVEANSWIARSTDGSGAKFLTADQRAVWRTAPTDPVLAQMLCATTMMLGDRPVAFSFDLDAGPIRYVIAGSYAKDLEPCYVGKVIDFRSMEHAVRAGLQVIDMGVRMGVGDSGSKREMSAQPRYGWADLLFTRSALAARVLACVWGSAVRKGACADG